MRAKGMCSEDRRGARHGRKIELGLAAKLSHLREREWCAPPKRRYIPL